MIVFVNLLAQRNRTKADAVAFIVIMLFALPAPIWVHAQTYSASALKHLTDGNELLTRHQYIAAQRHFQGALLEVPQSPQAHNNLGLCYLRQGQLNKASDEFSAALQTNPDYSPSLNNLGTVMYEQKHYRQAASLYQQALAAVRNGDPEIQTNLGNVLRDQGLYGDAIKYYEAAIKLQPGFAPAHNNLGLTFHFMHQDGPAIAQIANALNLKPDYSQAYCNLGRIYVRQRKYQSAESALHNAVDYAQGHYALAYNLLGIISNQKSDPVSAIKYYRLSIAQSDDSLPVVHLNLAIALAKMNLPQQAKREYQSYLLKAPDGLNVNFARARLNVGA